MVACLQGGNTNPEPCEPMPSDGRQHRRAPNQSPLLRPPHPANTPLAALRDTYAPNDPDRANIGQRPKRKVPPDGQCFTSDRSSPPNHQRQRSHLQLLQNQQRSSKGDAPSANSGQCWHSYRAETPLLTRASLSRFAVNYRQSQRQPFRPRQLPHHDLRHAAPSAHQPCPPTPLTRYPAQRRRRLSPPFATRTHSLTIPARLASTFSDAPIEERRPKRKMPPGGRHFCGTSR